MAEIKLAPRLSDIGKQFLAGLIEKREHTQSLGSRAARRIAATSNYDDRQFRCRIVLLGEIVEAASLGQMKIKVQTAAPAGHIPLANSSLDRQSSTTMPCDLSSSFSERAPPRHHRLHK